MFLLNGRFTGSAHNDNGLLFLVVRTNAGIHPNQPRLERDYFTRTFSSPIPVEISRLTFFSPSR